MDGNHATDNRYYACAGHSTICERQAKILHQMSKQTLQHKTTDNQTNGSFVVDEEGESMPP
ncbi:hypothetical protein [Micromonospora sp. IBHARD004]|uniref:hypothetical protein n=1 Tax=Micromonospora sp. IBHARD004 TaxID=3457764 RepID=UPI004059FC50